MILSLLFLITGAWTQDQASGSPGAEMRPAPSGTSRSRAPLPSMPNWPQSFPSTGYAMAGNLLADINGDGLYEVLVGTGSGLSVYDYQGNILWQYPTAAKITQRPSVADLNGDGSAEIAFVATTNSTGYIYLVDSQGTALAGWPKTVGDNPTTPVLWDLDGDGDLEVILGQRDYPSGRVDVWDWQGNELAGWPQTLDYMCVATPSVGDVDDDGDFEVVAISYYSLYIWGPDGTGELALTNEWGGQSYAQPTLFDLDGDGDLEIAVTFYTGGADSVAVFQHNGNRVWARALGGPQAYTTPVASDVLEDGLGDVELLDAMNHNATSNWFHMFDEAGNEMPGWPVSINSFTESTPMAFDFDADGELEFLMPNNGTPGGLFVFNRDGSAASGSPFDTQGPVFTGAGHVADVDGDGDPEICLLCDPGPVYVNLWTLDGIKWRRYLAPYPMRFHDLWATGWIHPARPLGLVATQNGSNVDLSWAPNPEPDLAGYFVYRRTSSSDWDTIGFTQGTSFTDSSPPPTLYWYGVTAYIKGDVESYMDTTEITLAAGERDGRTAAPGIMAVGKNLVITGTGQLRVYEATGRLCLDKAVVGRARLAMSHPGIYIATLKTEAGVLREKVVIR